jgi:molybdopterin-guanine dinucleotide biosynthesis protein A
MALVSKRPGSGLRLRVAPRLVRKRKPPHPVRFDAQIVGVVLAGGRSTRMGRDKALLQLRENEEHLLGRTVELLQEVCGRAVVVGRRVPGYASVNDAAPDCGPVGGIATALEYCEGAACLILSCDMPFMSKEILQRLIDHRNRRSPGKYVTAWRAAKDAKLQPLAAIYEPQCLPHFQICVNERLLKIRRVVPPYQWQYVEYPDEDEIFFFNLNSPADLEEALSLMGGKADTM